MSFDELISALMKKLEYTDKCITDMQKAIFTKGVYINGLTPLDEYASKIMLIVDGQLDVTKTILVEFIDLFDGFADSVTAYGSLKKHMGSEFGMGDAAVLILPGVYKISSIDMFAFTDTVFAEVSPK